MPGAEDVGSEVRAPADEPAARFGRAPGHVVAAAEGPLQVVLGAGWGIPDGDAMPPPELPADAPIPLLAEPIEVALGITLGMNLHPAGCDGIHRDLSQARLATPVVAHPDEPLVRQVRLDRRLAPIGVVDPGRVGLDLLEQALRLQV